ncbi:MAG: qbdA [Verrucomicrobia bacterium]|jgi:outer membrane protein assembly factor BamB|nr:qbdA [Verrucomicrobiota bacterium]
MTRFSLVLSLALLTVLNARADDWPQWLGPERDGVWREKNIVETFPKDGPTYRWRKPVGGGYSGPVVAKGRVYVTDRQLATGAANPNDPFARGKIPGTERVLCLDEKTGETLWTHEYPCDYTVSYAAGPRATPSVDDGRVYAVGAEGNLVCLDAVKGTLIWQKDYKTDYTAKTQIWGFASPPLIDGDRVICIVGGTTASVAAFDKKTGKELWRGAAVKDAGYAPPVIYTLAGVRQVIVWTGDGISALKPSTGEVLWNHPWPLRFSLAVVTPRQVGKDQLFFTAFYNGSLMLKISPENKTPEILWQSAKVSESDTDKLNSIMPTPVITADTIYGVCSYGQLRGLKLSTGERLWETRQPTTSGKNLRWGNAFIIPQGSRYFLFNEAGELIIANMTPEGYTEVDRMKVLEPTNKDARTRNVVWVHPAFANGHMLIRNDQEIVSVDLRAK